MSQKRVRFSFRGPGSLSHWRKTWNPLKCRIVTYFSQKNVIHLCYLCKRPRPSLDGKLGVAQLTVAGVRRGQPLLQAAFVYRAQRSGAVARGQKPLAVAHVLTLMADPTNRSIANKERSNLTLDHEIMWSSYQPIKHTSINRKAPIAEPTGYSFVFIIGFVSGSAYLCVPRALITVDSKRPSLAVTWVTYWARRLSSSSTVFDRAVLPVQSHREPGRWQHSPVVIVGSSRRAGGGILGSSLAPTPYVR